MSSQSFLDHIVLVTGSGRGIGRAIALNFAHLGADVIVNYVRNEKPAQEVVAEIESLGRKTLLVKANLSKIEEIESMFEQIDQKFGKLDIFISNAASGFNRPGMEQKAKGWDWTMDVNTRAFLFAAQCAVPLMEQSGRGWMVTLSSPGAVRVLPDYISVGASKAALEALTRYLAHELAEKNISVNGVAPGLVLTDALQHFAALSDPEVITKAVENTPAGRLVTPEDVAGVVAFLCSEAAFMIRGQIITMDGGHTLGVPK